jgi:uncharacterized membrane protein
MTIITNLGSNAGKSRLGHFQSKSRYLHDIIHKNKGYNLVPFLTHIKLLNLCVINVHLKFLQRKRKVKKI